MNMHTEEDLEFMMVKPEGMAHFEDILEMIKERGMQIIDSQKTILTPSNIWDLYEPVFREKLEHSKTTGEDFINEYTNYMTSSESGLLIVGNLENNDIYQKALELRGAHYRGDACDPHSIRFKFQGQIQHLNSFHASQDSEETKRHMMIFRELLLGRSFGNEN